MKAYPGATRRVGSIDFAFPYDAAPVEELKGLVPHTARTYTPGTRTYRVSESHAALVQRYRPDRLPAPGRATDKATPATIHVAYGQITGGAR